jgi:hypothetical protein
MIKIFISHSSNDAQIAELLIDLFRAALNIPAHEIRCTSVNGYGLPISASVEKNLREEIFISTIFIGLLSKSSMQSTYVLFELGARWGAQKNSIILLMPDIAIKDLKPPISGSNILKCDDESNLHQMIDEIAPLLNLQRSNTSSYIGKIRNVIEAIKRPLLILNPFEGDTVPLRPIVNGKVVNSNSDVWLIVHPIGSSAYYIQPKAKVEKSGQWKAKIYIGRDGTIDIGSQSEILAIANPAEIVKEGDIRHSWPLAEHKSQVVKLIRG